jgi:hypothetical protein
VNARPATEWDDFGDQCAEVRRLPLAGGANILCGRRGYDLEIAFRRARVRCGVHYDLPAWESLEIVFPKKESNP